MTESESPARRAGEDRWDWIAALFLGTVALWWADSTARTLVERMHFIWDGQRLAPVFAVRHGYPLYPRESESPPVGYTYGPMSVYAYLPATLAGDPTRALLGALALSFLYVFGPIAALLLKVAPRGAGWRGSLGLGMLLAVILSQNPALAYSSMSPSHDAVALGFGLLACLPFLCREAIGWKPLALSAVLAVGAVAAKQNAVFYLPTLLLYCLFTFGPRASLAYAGFLFGFGLAGALALVRLHGAVPLAHFLFGIQGGMEYYASRLGTILRSLFTMSFPPLLLIGSVLYLRSAVGGPGRPRGSLKFRLRRNPWVLPLLVGLGDLPIALLATLKRGGDVNSLSYTIYFLVAAASALVTEAAARGIGPSAELGKCSLRALAAWTCAPWILAQVLAISSPPLAFEATKAARRLRENPNQVAYEYAKRHPGTAYFPWNTLAVLMAEGRLFASEDAIVHIPPPGAPRAYTWDASVFPPSPQYIAFPPQVDPRLGRSVALEQYFTRYRRRVNVPGLEGFNVYARVGSNR